MKRLWMKWFASGWYCEYDQCGHLYYARGKAFAIAIEMWHWVRCWK